MMTNSKRKDLYVIGVSFEKAEAETRGKFTFFPESIKKFVSESKARGIEELFVVSTCNRSEFYAVTDNPQEMVELYCKYTQGSAEELLPVMTQYQGEQAVQHLFEVAAGLKSQILGDFEIIGQIKIWFNRFKKHGSVNTYLERLVNTAIQISKKIKNQTCLSNGAASVSFAAVHYILQTQNNISNKNILLFGIGKIGRNTCDNLIKHTQNEHITLINRTREKADLLSQKYQVLVKDLSELKEELSKTDILIVATGANTYTITSDMIVKDKKMTIIDLSMPENVCPSLAQRENIQLINVDGLSKMVDETIDARKQEIPEAKKIIEEYKKEFDDWLKDRKFVPAIQSFKERLEVLQEFELKNLQKKHPEINGSETIVAQRLIQNLTNQFAAYILNNRENAEETLSVMEDIFKIKAKP